MPELRPLLLAAGFGGVTSWDRRDAVTFLLRWITRNAEAAVDLLGCTQELAEAASDHPELIIILTRRAGPCSRYPACSAPLQRPRTPKFDIAGYHACALALVAATPPDRLLPDPMDTALNSTVEQAAPKRCAALDPVLSWAVGRTPTSPPDVALEAPTTGSVRRARGELSRYA